VVSKVCCHMLAFSSCSAFRSYLNEGTRVKEGGSKGGHRIVVAGSSAIVFLSSS